MLTVPLMGWAPEILNTWINDTDCRHRMTFGAASPWLWPSERGAQLSLDSYATRFTDHRRAAGLPDGLSLHGFRRSYVTIGCAATCPDCGFVATRPSRSRISVASTTSPYAEHNASSAGPSPGFSRSRTDRSGTSLSHS